MSTASPFIIHPTLKVELPASHAGSWALMCLLFLGCWRLCVALLTFGSALALVIHMQPLSISDLFFHFEKESTVTRVVKMDAECGSVFGPMKSGVAFWIPDLREHKQY